MLDVEKDRLEISRGSTSEAGELVQTVSVSIREESTVSWSIEITTSDPSYINAALQLKSGTGCALCEALAVFRPVDGPFLHGPIDWVISGQAS